MRDADELIERPEGGDDFRGRREERNDPHAIRASAGTE
jgi:hypothetical protein